MRPSRYIFYIIALVLSFGCKSIQKTKTQDTGIVTTAPENQGGTAFCWAYAIVAHLEQRYFETTRGQDAGGFRLNFSEEYLGLVHMTLQMIAGNSPNEGLLLSDSLELIEKYGIVPEKIRDKELFKPRFDTALTDSFQTAADQYWTSKTLAPNTPIPALDALKITQQTAGLSSEQTAFLASAMGLSSTASASFPYHSTTYTPQTFAHDYLKFKKADYYILKFPDSGRGNFGTSPFTAEYLRVINIVKKAMLYGYSVPISLNQVKGAKFENGTIECEEDHCFDAEIAEGTADWPHANHAVLLIDFRSEKSDFGPTPKDGFDMTTAPKDWVIKNSWGFNVNTSSEPILLKRCPLPAYTIMAQDFFEASHRLIPDRFEAIVPRQVCVRDVSRQMVCSDLVKSTEVSGLPKSDQTDLTINASLIASNFQKGSLSRYPVTFAKSIKQGDGTNLHFETAKETTAKLEHKNVAPNAVFSSSNEEFMVCVKAVPKQNISYVAMYVSENGAAPSETPTFVLNIQSNWQHCFRVENSPKTLEFTLQGLTEKYSPIEQIKATVTIK